MAIFLPAWTAALLIVAVVATVVFTRERTRANGGRALALWALALAVLAATTLWLRA